MFSDRGQRTEKPTLKRLQRARSEGQLPRTRELSGALGLAAFLAFCHLAGTDWLDRLEGFLAQSLTHLNVPELGPTELVALPGQLGWTTLLLLMLPLGVMAGAGVAGNLVQGPPSFTLKPLTPKLSRLNPIQGLGKLFQLKSWVELLKTSIKLGLYTAIALSAVADAFEHGLVGGPGAEGALLGILGVSGKVVFRVTLLALALALLDLLYTRFDHTRSLRMTKQEIKDERKEQEGDPLLKSRLRAKQLAFARSRMMADVPRATVIITNPTHYAVALRYVPDETDVPQLLAKGQALIAERIRALAAVHGIPLISDPPLARALYRAVPVGGFIPPQLFRAVAEVLALVLGRRGRRAAAQPVPESRT